MHPDEETLERYAERRESVPDPERVDEHLSQCPECAAFVDRARELYAALANPDTWLYADERETAAMPDELLQAFRARAAEDREAREQLAPYLANPFALVWRDLSQKPALRTAGVVRLLCDEALVACEADPRHARELAERAMLLVEVLDPAHYSAAELDHLRGLVWKAEANALRRLGDLKGALGALDHAARDFMRLPDPSGPLASVAYVRADVLSVMGRLDEAAALARSAAATFAAQGKTTKYMHARLLAGVIAFRRSDFATAREIFEPLLDQAQADGDARLSAHLSQNLGRTYLGLGMVAMAGEQLHAAARLWQKLGVRTEEARTRWSMADLLLQTGRFDDAAVRFAEVQNEFDALAMRDEATLVRLDRIVALLLAGRSREAQTIGSGLVEELIDLGLLPAAYTALAYVQESAIAGTLTAAKVRHARAFLRGLGENPALLFAPLIE